MDFSKIIACDVPKGKVKSLHIDGVLVWIVKDGLYNENDNLIALWRTLVDDYGLDVEKGYGYTYKDNVTHLHNIMTNNSKLVGGKKLIIENTVEKIGSYGLSNDLLTSIEIPDSVTSIGRNGVSNCDLLTSVTIGNGVTSIGNNAFAHNPKLKRVDFSTHTSIPTLGTNAFNNTFSKLQIKVPADLENDWKSATNWSEYADKIVTEFTN